jgi:hypothetical protein
LFISGLKFKLFFLQDKSRLTVLLASNAIGSHKLRPLVIGHSKKPRCFNGLNLSQLPVTYKNNSRAWMRSDIWEDWLRYIDAGFRIQNRKILLLVDNAPSHNTPILRKTSVIANDETEDINNGDQERMSGESDSGDHESDEPQDHGRSLGRLRGRPTTIHELDQQSDSGGDNVDEPQTSSHREDHGRSYGQHRNDSLDLTNITLHYLPPNTTAHIQPMDAGIIKSFKSKYKHIYCKHILEQFEANVNLERYIEFFTLMLLNSFD